MARRYRLVMLVWIGLMLSGTRLQAVEGWTAEMALRVKRISDIAVSPDGTRVAYVVATAVMQGEVSQWRSHVHVAQSDGSESFQLTRGDASATAPAWSPDGRWIAFRSSRNGQSANLWRIRIGGGEAQPLTDGKGDISALEWSPDGSQIAFVMADPKTDQQRLAEKEKRDAWVVDENVTWSRLYVVSAEAGDEGKRPVRRLTGGDLHVGGTYRGHSFDWSPDGKQIVFSHRPTPQVDRWPESDLSIVDVADGTTRTLVATGAAEGQPTFSPDGELIAYSASDDPPTWAFSGRVHLIKPSGEAVGMLAETHDSQPTIVGWSPDARRLLISETYHTVNRLSALPVDGSPEVHLSPPDMMVAGAAISGRGTHVGFVTESLDRPPEAFVSPAADFQARQVSRVQYGPLAPLGKTAVVTWKSTDGRTIEGLLTLPVGYKPAAPVPMLVVVHGGPMGVFTRRFIASYGAYPIAAFASRGYAILRCNVRGSSGYGREFRYANYHDWGGGDYRDIMSGVDAMIERKIADSKRLGVMGWSYGGFMTSWIITQTDRFKAASVGAGVTNLMSFTGTSDIPGFLPDYFGGEYWDQFDRWRSHSAMFNVKGVSTPTLIQHGEKDRRVPISQGYELYNALKRQGVSVRMVVYPRQPHGIQEPKLQRDAMERNLKWFDRWINGATTAAK